MRRWILASSFGLALVAGGSVLCVSASAGDQWHDFWHRTKVDFYRNNTWPEPFRTEDRGAQREPFCIMVNNGWKMQNTIGVFMFNHETQELNTAGEAKVKWVVTQAPIHRRAVFVLMGDTPEDTQKRVQSVQAFISRIVPPGHLPPVMLTDREPEGASGEYFDAIHRATIQSIPSPRLPGGASGSSAQSGGSGN